jgi:hypothetical protein
LDLNFFAPPKGVGPRFPYWVLVTSRLCHCPYPPRTPRGLATHPLWTRCLVLVIFIFIIALEDRWDCPCSRRKSRTPSQRGRGRVRIWTWVSLQCQGFLYTPSLLGVLTWSHPISRVCRTCCLEIKLEQCHNSGQENVF